ncbi:MAG: putative transposase [Lentimonas sp.]|jgi:putative transposase
MERSPTVRFIWLWALTCRGKKEVLGLWSSPNEGVKFWLNVLTELQNRGLQDIFFSGVDGLSGFPEAIENVYPQTRVQLCIVHMLRNSFKFVGWKERKEVAAELKNIYTAPTAAAAKDALTRFREIYDKRFPAIGKS